MKVLTLVLVLGLAGCVSMTPEASRIAVIHNPNAVRECTSLGEIRATSLFSVAGGGIWNLLIGNAADIGYENNEREMRREAAARGGTSLLMLQERVGSELKSLGEVYRCP